MKRKHFLHYRNQPWTCHLFLVSTICWEFLTVMAYPDNLANPRIPGGTLLTEKEKYRRLFTRISHFGKMWKMPKWTRKSVRHALHRWERLWKPQFSLERLLQTSSRDHIDFPLIQRRFYKFGGCEWVPKESFPHRKNWGFVGNNWNSIRFAWDWINHICLPLIHVDTP